MRLGRRRLSLVLQALQFYNDAYLCGIKSGDYVCSVSCKCEKQMCVTDGASPIASSVPHRPTRLRLPSHALLLSPQCTRSASSTCTARR
jgi:hypothetical protein